VRLSDGWRLDGRKQFITNARYAPLAIVLARVANGEADRHTRAKVPAHAGITAFVVAMNAKGVSVGAPERKLGLRASDTSALVLDGARVDDDATLGEVGKGFAIAMAGLDGGRIGIAAQSVGIARAALARARAYARQRRQFGRPIAEFEAVRFELAERESEVAAARMLMLRAAWLRDSGRPFTREAAMAKLYASEMAQRATHAAVQILGGYGYMRDYGVERYARDGRATTIYEGTSEIQRIVIARSLLAA
jgi:alkylation response protein AidB-like acyl-CoA dehydrogenase